MRRSTQRPLLLPFILGLSTLLLSGCGLGTIVPHTQSMRPAGNGAQLNEGDIQLSGLVAVTDADGTVLSGVIVNRGELDDQVIAVSVDGAAAYISPEQLLVPGDSLVKIGYQSEQTVAVASPLQPGTSVGVTFVFASGLEVGGSVLVVSPTGAYEGIDPQPLPSASPTS